MTYGEFKSAVTEMLLEEGLIHGTDSYLDRHIRIALIEALSYFPALRPDETLEITADDVLIVGNSAQADIPQGVRINELMLVPTGWVFTDSDSRSAQTDGLGGISVLSDGQTFSIQDAGNSGFPVRKILTTQETNGRAVPTLDGTTIKENITLKLI